MKSRTRKELLSKITTLRNRIKNNQYPYGIFSIDDHQQDFLWYCGYEDTKNQVIDLLDELIRGEIND